MNLILKLHQISQRYDDLILRWGGSLLSLFIRCYVAWQFLHAGWLKLQNWQGTLELFQSEYHVPVLPPMIAAYTGAGGELVFPILLILGLFSRPAALGLFCVNLMAVVSYPQLWDFECPAAIDDHFYWGAFILFVMIFGAGRFSLDAWLTKRHASNAATDQA